VREKEREREGPIESVDSVINLSPLIKRELGVVRRNTCHIFWLLACGKRAEQSEERPPEKKKKEGKEKGDHTYKQHNTLKTTTRKRKKKCFAER
jgi:hypothetical protein